MNKKYNIIEETLCLACKSGLCFFSYKYNMQKTPQIENHLSEVRYTCAYFTGRGFPAGYIRSNLICRFHRYSITADSTLCPYTNLTVDITSASTVSLPAGQSVFHTGPHTLPEPVTDIPCDNLNDILYTGKYHLQPQITYLVTYPSCPHCPYLPRYSLGTDYRRIIQYISIYGILYVYVFYIWYIYSYNAVLPRCPG